MFFTKKNDLPEPGFDKLLFTVKDQLKVDKIENLPELDKGRVPEDPGERVSLIGYTKKVRLKALWIGCYLLSVEGILIPKAYKKLIQLSNEIGLTVNDVDDMIQTIVTEIKIKHSQEKKNQNHQVLA